MHRLTEEEWEINEAAQTQACRITIGAISKAEAEQKLGKAAHKIAEGDMDLSAKLFMYGMGRLEYHLNSFNDSPYLRRPHGDWMGTELEDALGREIKVGDTVVRACTSGRAVNLEFGKVRQIKNNKVYLDTSKVPIAYPGRLLVINKLLERGEGKCEAQSQQA